jgi:hypothetical protein
MERFQRDSRDACLAPMRMSGSASSVSPIALAGGFNAWDDFGLLDLKLGWFPAVTEKKATLKGRKPPAGDKRQFLLSMDAEVIKSIKLAAVEDDTTASATMEDAAKQWLERRKKQK